MSPRPRRNAGWARWTLAKMHREDEHSIKACGDLRGSLSVLGIKPSPPQSSCAWGHQLQVNGAQERGLATEAHVDRLLAAGPRIGWSRQSESS